MPNILHQIKINATPEHVFDLIASSEGLRSWWTHDVDAEPVEGSMAIFGFNDRATVFRMRIDELVGGRRVKWTCMGDSDEWERTEVEFHLTPAGRGVDLHFAHRGWRSLGGEYARCNTTWGALMHRLKGAAEGQTPGPLFPL
jgi:uncharacterized protein YndB with AHSA1/START domain